MFALAPLSDVIASVLDYTADNLLSGTGIVKIGLAPPDGSCTSCAGIQIPQRESQSSPKLSKTLELSQNADGALVVTYM